MSVLYKSREENGVRRYATGEERRDYNEGELSLIRSGRRTEARAAWAARRVDSSERYEKRLW